MGDLQHFLDIQCPYCGEWIGIVVDASVDEQSYVEDCQVCCRPIQLDVRIDDDGTPDVRARSQDEG
ncbi:MAG TPA: CPXCG motif-containing cysteine-rich protein [Stenotrophomonas sp.]|nr:CPXCG motif-containing cysteine-rich protein [Stenotrophomonas sp.]